MPISTPFAFQLYSARNFFPLENVLTNLAEIGFTNVEPFPSLYDDPASLKAMLSNYGLTAKSGHVSLRDVEEDSDQTCRMAETLGMETIVLPFIPANIRPTDKQGWLEMGERLSAASRVFAKRGFSFAWHNHDFEFEALPDGTIPLELLLGEDVMWEADLAWVVRSGNDPKHWLKRYSGRIPAIHVKDLALPGEKVDEKGWADVGTGVVPWAELWPLVVESGAKIMIAEHDQPSDYDRFARQSYRTMSKLNGGN
ncbi:TIM barrel protein [Rhizobium leguminosarum]|nr:TIM barrel protein [Rhizobium leguminosarum]